jgi:hypothetical protein
VVKEIGEILINLTPFIPLSTLGEGEDIKKEGLAPLFDWPILNTVV